MAKKIISEDIGKNQELSNVVNDIITESNQDMDWEEQCYQHGCAMARKEAIKRLATMEERLYIQRPKGWHTIGFRERTVYTRFGELRVMRRLYQDEKKGYHFLLDEYLNWQPYQKATPSLTEALVDLSTEISFQRVSHKMEKLMASVLSDTTIHRLLQKVSKNAIDGEKADWDAWYEQGIIPPPGERKVSLLYNESDGLWVHLQRESQEHYELKSAIAYEGWEQIPGGKEGEERYRLVNKRIYSHSDESIPFWEGASLQWDRWWDSGRLELTVLGGDGANWIETGTSEIPFCVFQASGFHLSRACRRGWENGGELYDAIRWGKVGESNGVISLLGTGPPFKERPGKTAQKSRDYVLKRLETGKDWRKKLEGVIDILPGARGLGAMEGNEDKLFANRLKKRGMSWTIKGVQRMGKAIQLSFHGELGKWCGCSLPESPKEKGVLSFDLFESQGGFGARSLLPALEGPHASRPWAKALKDMAMPQHLLN